MELSQRAIELFKSSEPHQKRQIIQLTLQNLTMDGTILRYDWQNPFSTLAEFASNQSWLPLIDAFRNREIKLSHQPEVLILALDSLGIKPYSIQ